MSDSWQTRNLGEIVKIQQGKYVSKDALSPTKNEFSRFPVIGANGVLGFTDKATYETPVALVTCRGSNCGLIQWIQEPAWVSNNAMALQALPGFDNHFIRYMSENANFDDVTTGSAQPQITRTNLESKPFLVPPLDEQRRIAGVLGAMDELIEVNRGLIMSLLETVDAEFAREFVHRDLTLTLGSFTKIVDCLHSKKPERVETSHRLLQLSNIDDSGQLETNDFYGISRDDYVRWTKNLETREWDCVITNVGRVGAVARIPSGVHAALGRNMTAIRPIDPESDGAFVIAGLRAQPVRREIELRTDSGTVMDALNVKNIPSLRLPQASSDERAAFQSFAAPLLRAADGLRSENSLLASTRDELLPLLMSGRVRVAEVVAA